MNFFQLCLASVENKLTSSPLCLINGRLGFILNSRPVLALDCVISFHPCQG